MGHAVVVIGAGVVGAATALALGRDGHDVLLLDRAGPAAGASAGNAGAIVNGSCAPTAMPGVWKQAVRSVLDTRSPLSIRPLYVPKALPWLVRFLLASRRSRVARIASELHALTERAVTDWRTLMDGTAAARFLVEGGWLKLYESERSFAATAAARRLMDEAGSPYEVLSADDIQDLEPHLAPIFEYGIFQRDSLRVTSPARLVGALVDEFVAAGGEFRPFDVTGIETGSDAVRIVGDGDGIDAACAVVAAGAWSKPLAAGLGDAVPLDAERGYHVMLPRGTESLLNRPVMNGDLSFVLSPMETGLRMTGQVEIAGVDAAPDFRRIRRLLPQAKRMLPALDATEQSVWMGCRPSLPDSLPVIGRSAASPAVLYAFGHQHLGLTLAATTGRLIADLVAGREPLVDLTPYRADRY